MHKSQMIGSMDQVYSKAFLTIVAAAGHDAYHGLPGVGKTCRKRQAALKIGKVNLLEHLSPHPGTLLKTSAWGTRGWTCQEGLLSRRRLVFTDQQTSFVCEKCSSWNRSSVQNNTFGRSTMSRSRSWKLWFHLTVKD